MSKRQQYAEIEELQRGKLELTTSYRTSNYKLPILTILGIYGLIG